MGNRGSTPSTTRIDRTADPLSRTVQFVLRDGDAEIRCCITFEALQRLARVAGQATEIAEQLFDRHHRDIELMALTRYAAGDFAGGVVRIDVNDLRLPANEP